MRARPRKTRRSRTCGASSKRSRTSWAAPSAADARERPRDLTRAVLNPVGIGAQDLVDRPGRDARHLIAVQRRDASDEGVALPMVRLEDGGDLVRRLDLAFPAVDRADRPED